MNEINYIGEWLGLGNTGHLLTITSMVAAIMATISFFTATQLENKDLTKSQSWKRLGRIGFGINALSILGIIAILFVLILKHRFEFKYVWQHSSLDLPIYYMISCFWEGQEGSFLLWQFWIATLGIFLIVKAKKWESSVMAVMSFMQIFLAAMLIGLYFFEYKIGSSPFLLLRMDPEMTANAPIFMRANYLDFIKDGTGLNPLLQNYWMVIHPPTLFLGFAACIVPFAYVMAGLWKRDFTNWIRPTLAWSLFAGAILGTGVLMGGAWAYEALSFGGFWAWDPVENASLVPWLVLVGGIHTLVVYKHTGRSLQATNIFLILTFLLILYSTFLTRSGILGDTSVHSFTDLGMSGQLLVFMFSFIILAVVLLIRGWSAMPSDKKEEHIYSREFWMFVGSLIMVMLAALITIDTSWPVINKVFGTNKAIVEPIEHYNRYSLWFAIVAALLSAVSQYFRYKKSNITQFLKKLSISTIVSLLIALAIGYSIDMGLSQWHYFLFLWMSLYVIVANANYLITVLSGKIKVAGASVAHIGFGLILLGVLLSAGRQKVLSLNTLGIKYGDEWTDENNAEHVLIYKDKPIQMGEYWVTYTKNFEEGVNTFYEVKYEKKEAKTDNAEEVFTLYPNAQQNPNMGLIANPATKHYLTRDVFTHVSSVSKPADNEVEEHLQEVELSIGDTAIVNNMFFTLTKINPKPSSLTYIPVDGDIAAGAKLVVIDKLGTTHEVEPIYYIRDNLENNIPAEIEALNTTIKFDKIYPEKSQIKLSVIHRGLPEEWIILKAIEFPFINVLWLGCFVMVIGFFMSMRQRLRMRLN